MRVAFLTHEPFYPPSGGGSAEAVYLVQELIQRGHEVHLFCPAFPDPDKIQKLFAAERTANLPSAFPKNRRTSDPSREGNKNSSAPRESPSWEELGVGAGTRGANRGREDFSTSAAAAGASNRLQCHLFTTWEMGRYTALRNFKYLAYLIFLRRMVERAARHVRFD